MDLALVWAGIIAFAVLAYAMLDGFDLGVGILFLWFDDATEKDRVINSIAPIWDGNETWLVLGGGGLFAVFPLAYSTVLTAFYAPVIAMLLALVLRGVSMEYRAKTRAFRSYWNMGFWLGSVTAALAQGIMLGAFIQGIEVADRRYIGGWFDWLTPFSLTCGLAIVIGYAVLGGCWVVLKAPQELANRTRAWLPSLAIALIGLITIVSSWTPFLDNRLTERWFSLPNLLWLTPVPVLVAFITWRLLRAIRCGGDVAPFLWAQALFVVTYIGFGISTYPFIVPHSITIWEAAAPASSLSFLLVGTLVLLPIIIFYTAHAYWVFRGKVGDNASYH